MSLGRIDFGCGLSLAVWNIELKGGQLVMTAEGSIKGQEVPTGFVPLSIYGKDGVLIASGRVDVTESFADARKLGVNYIYLTQSLNVDSVVFRP